VAADEALAVAEGGGGLDARDLGGLRHDRRAQLGTAEAAGLDDEVALVRALDRV
jgi:hypothetical protein